MDFRLKLGDLDLCDYPFSIEFGADLGAPANLTEALAKLLQDGEIELSDRASNRSLTFTVLVEGSDMAALAEAEADLIAETEKPLNLLTMDPGDGYGPASVFETFRGQVTFQRDDNLEIAGYRRYEVAVRAYPFVRSAVETVTAAEKSGDATSVPTVTQVTVADGSSAAGWGGDYFRYDGANQLIEANAATVASASGEVYALTPAGGGRRLVMRLVKTQTIDVSSTKQLAVNWRWDQSPARASQAVGFRCLVNEAVELPVIDGIATPGRTVPTRTTFKVPDSLNSITSIRFIFESRIPDTVIINNADTQADAFYIDNIERNNANLASGTPRQLQRSLAVGGSARTLGRVAIEHNTASLGDVLAYFRPDDGTLYSPPLRRWRVSGPGANVDSTLVSGIYDNIGSALISFRVPAQRIPAGRYLLMARLGGANTSLNILWNAGTMYGSADVGPTQTGTTPVTITTGYQIFPIARLQLPTRDMDPSTTADVRVEMVAQGGTGGVCRLDEAWLFNMSTGRLVQVPCGTGTPAVGGPANRCWIEPATVDRPRPTVRVGTAMNRSDARYAMDSAFSAWQFPEFTPGSMQVFTVTTNALEAAVSLAAYERFHTHAAS